MIERSIRFSHHFALRGCRRTKLAGWFAGMAMKAGAKRLKRFLAGLPDSVAEERVDGEVPVDGEVSVPVSVSVGAR